MNENAITIVEPAPTSPLTIIERAVAAGANADQLGKLLELQERYEANEARKAFTDALTAFKANPPAIFKNHEVSHNGKPMYKHATLDNVCDVLNSALAPHGLSFRWETATEANGIIKVTCILTHRLGHSERTTLQATADTSGAKNAIQAVGSTVTYLQRYTALAATGMAVQGQDDDGLGASRREDGPISEAEAREIERGLEDTGSDKARFCAVFNIGSIPELKRSQIDKARNMIAAKRSKR